MREVYKRKASFCGGLGLGGGLWVMDYFHIEVPRIGAYLVAISSVGLIVYSAYLWGMYLWPYIALKISGKSSRELVPLPEAAKIAFGELRKTEIGRAAGYMKAITPINYFAQHLISPGFKDPHLEPALIYGNHVHSPKIEIISRKELGSLKEDSLSSGPNGEPVKWENLKIEKKFLEQYIKRAKGIYRETTHT